MFYDIIELFSEPPQLRWMIRKQGTSEGERKIGNGTDLNSDLIITLRTVCAIITRRGGGRGG